MDSEIKIQLVLGHPFPRYVIRWGEDLYWDGDGWTPERTQALLYAKLPMVKDDWQAILKQQSEEETHERR